MWWLRVQDAPQESCELTQWRWLVTPTLKTCSTQPLGPFWRHLRLDLLVPFSVLQVEFHTIRRLLLPPSTPFRCSADEALLQSPLPLKSGPERWGKLSPVIYCWDVGWLGRGRRKVMSCRVKPPSSKSSLGLDAEWMATRWYRAGTLHDSLVLSALRAMRWAPRFQGRLVLDRKTLSTITPHTAQN